jgi:peptidoglycan L-alanyl-D-glutamate endopeptidase CwlK
MPSFGRQSTARLATVHHELRAICNAVIKHYDFTIIWGFRNRAEQNDCFSRGASTKRFPDSKHNTRFVTTNGDIECSDAIDVAPWHADLPHIRWENELEFVQLSGRLLQVADEFGIAVRYGGDWDSDDDLYDRNKPFDLGHIERL